MKVLLSAYACIPHKGSEYGVGWHWAIEIAQLGHEVFVLTRTNNRENIETELANGSYPDNLHFIYYDLPTWTHWTVKGAISIYLYYFLWQWGAVKIAQNAHKRENFDLVHHITYGSIRSPSFMGKIGIPFVLGPVGGGEFAPFRLRKGYSFKRHIYDTIRDVSNGLIRFDPVANYSYSSADRIIVTSEQSKLCLNRRHWKKTDIVLSIGSDDYRSKYKQPVRKEEYNNLLFVARPISWKGLRILLDTVKLLTKTMPLVRLRIRGDGHEEGRWRKYSKKINLDNIVSWVPRLSTIELDELYNSSDIFVFPSLHDSGGQAALEALSHGLPVVCLDLGGPGVIVDETCGYAIKTDGRSYDEMIGDMSKTIADIACNPQQYEKLSRGALARARDYSWEKQVRKIYDDIPIWNKRSK